jgi:hypothetical protein
LSTKPGFLLGGTKPGSCTNHLGQRAGGRPCYCSRRNGQLSFRP